jgi:hypothetical protein
MKIGRRRLCLLLFLGLESAGLENESTSCGLRGVFNSPSHFLMWNQLKRSDKSSLFLFSVDLDKQPLETRRRDYKSLLGVTRGSFSVNLLPARCLLEFSVPSSGIAHR